MILQKRKEKVKLSVDLSKENYEALCLLKQQSQTSFGKIINLILSEHLKDAVVEDN